MKITREDPSGLREVAEKWAKTNKAKFAEREGSFWIHKGEWGVEVLADNGGAYVHGDGSLNGIGTNIADTDELDAAIKKLLDKENINYA